VKALNESWAWTERKWTRCSDDTGVGDPRKANLEKGKQYFQEVTSKLAKLFVELAGTDSRDMYV
jgi:creatinine amidohydrolase